MGAHVHQYPAAVDLREEVAPDPGAKREGPDHEQHKAAYEHHAMAQRHGQHFAIGEAPALEAGLESALQPDQRIARARPLIDAVAIVPAQHVFRHRRHQRAREDERPDHRRHDRLGERHEQEARHAGQEEHRHEHDADAQKRHECRRDDLLGPVEDRGLDVLALLEMPVDVLDGHRRLVDEDAHREREPAQGHEVERLAQHPERGDRAQHRSGIEVATIKVERQLPRNSRIIRPVSAAAIRPSRTTPPIAALHEQRLIADRRELEVARQRRPYLLDLLLDFVDDTKASRLPPDLSMTMSTERSIT